MKKAAGKTPPTQNELAELDGKRSLKRVRRRLMVRYGITAADRTAYTMDISTTGLSVHTNLVHRPGTTLEVQIHFPDRTISHWALVIWAKQGPPQLAHVVHCGMGLRFIEPGEEWLEYFQSWRKKVGAL